MLSRIVRWPPERLFLLFGGLWGALLVALIPPVAGGNETYNFGRAAGVATGHLQVGDAVMPGGMVALIDAAWAQFPSGSTPPFGYDAQKFAAVAAIPLDAARPRTLAANPIAVLHPVSYAVQAPAIALGMQFGLSPLALFTLGRLAGLAAGLALTWAAIRAMPAGRHALAALALLPTILFGRSTLDADQITNGLAFLFVALTLREIVKTGPITRGRLALLAVTAALLGPAKSAYLLLPLLALAIPRARFQSGTARWAAVAAIVLPGVALSLAWIASLAAGPLDGVSYRTWAGLVEPARQQAAILADPFAHAAVLLRTVFATPLLPDALIGLIGEFGPPVRLPAPAFPLLLLILAATVAWRDERVRFPLTARILAPLLVAASVAIVLTLLSLQWNPPGARVVEGFQGRYLFPVLPLLFCLLPPAKAGGRASAALLAMALLAGPLTLWTTWATYWA